MGEQDEKYHPPVVKAKATMTSSEAQSVNTTLKSERPADHPDDEGDEGEDAPGTGKLVPADDDD